MILNLGSAWSGREKSPALGWGLEPRGGGWRGIRSWGPRASEDREQGDTGSDSRFNSLILAAMLFVRDPVGGLLRGLRPQLPKAGDGSGQADGRCGPKVDETGRSLHVVCAESVCREPRAEARLPILLRLPPLLLPSSYVYGAHRKLSVCRSLSQSGNKGECLELHWL